MSGVKKSERKESKLDALHQVYKVRKLISYELLNDFGAKKDSVPGWLIEEERKRILNQCQNISIHLRRANVIWPVYWNEYKERRLQLDKAMEYCEALQDELQAIVLMIPTNINRYTQICREINKCFNYIKKLRQSDNRFTKKLKDTPVGYFCGSAYFGNVNNDGNLNGNNGASNVNGVRRDFTDHAKEKDSSVVNGKGEIVHLEENSSK